MNFRRELPTLRKRIVLVAVAVFTVVGVAAFPRIANAAGTVNMNPASISKVEGGSGSTNSFNVTFTLSEDNPNPVTVDIETQQLAGSPCATCATAGVDYVSEKRTLSFPAHDTSETVNFTGVKGDQLDENDEQLKIGFASTPTGGFSKGTEGTVTIQDDDAAPTVTIDDLAANEGNAGLTEFNFQLHIAPASGRQTKVHAKTVRRRDPAPTTPPAPPAQQPPRVTFPCPPANNCDADLEVFDADITIPAGATTAVVPVKVFGDLTDEPNEQFEVELSGGENIQTPNDFAVGIVKNDDGPPVINIDDAAAVVEGPPCGGGGEPACPVQHFTVTLSKASGKTVTVDYTTEDRSAEDGSDYEGISGSKTATPPNSPNPLTFAPGETSKTLDVTIIGDNSGEPDERYAVTLSAPVNATLGDAQGFGLILNDDGGNFPNVKIDGPASPVGEGAGNATFTVSATWPAGNCGDIVVHYNTADGSSEDPASGPAATAPADYTPTANGTVTLSRAQPCVPQTAGAGSASQPITVPVKQDTVDEATEFFQVQLSDATNANISDDVAEAGIADDDAAPKLDIVDKTVTEGTGETATVAKVTVTLTPASGQPVTVKYATSDNTAKAPEDYTDNDDILTFAPGETSKTFDVVVVADSMDESDETVNTTLTEPTGAEIQDGAGVLTITDDDAPPTVSINNTAVNEGTGDAPSVAQFSVVLSGKSGKPISVKASTSNGTATAPGDYTAQTNKDVLIPAGQDGALFDVPVVADSIDEADETFFVTLTSPTNATLAATPNDKASGTITDDDGSPTVTVAPASGNESAGKVTFTLSLSNSSEQPVTAHVKTTDGTATAPADYTAVTDSTVVIPAGELSKTFDVTVVNDTADEPDETFTLAITSASNAAVSSTNGSAAGTIVDNDGPAPGVTSKITTGAGPGGGPHIRVFQPNGTDAGVGFMDGAEANGKRVARGDLDGDGVDEIITGSGPNSPAGIAVYSATGTLRTSAYAYAGGNFYGGVFVAAGDVDGDGKDEIVTAAGPGGGPHVRVWDLASNGLTGNDGFMAYSNWNGGATVAVADVNKDGKDDIITGAGAGGGPHVKAFSGAGPVEMFGFMAFDGFNGGVNVAAGDLDGDGFAEIVIGAGPGGGPHLRLFNHDGTLRNPGIFAGNPDFRGGINVAAGDLDGVAGSDILVGGQTLTTRVRGFKADLSSLQGTNFDAYPGFGGGVYVAIGKS